MHYTAVNQRSWVLLSVFKTQDMPLRARQACLAHLFSASAYGQERKLPMPLAMLRFARKKIDKEVLFAGGEFRTPLQPISGLFK